MTIIIPGSLRYTDSKGVKSVAQPDSNLYKTICDVAQERFDKVTRCWVRIPEHCAKRVKRGDDYCVYLDGVIVPWWSAADSERGFVDVVLSVGTHHRLFGVVTLEHAVLNEL